jgi:hypothetical protein
MSSTSEHHRPIRIDLVEPSTNESDEEETNKAVKPTKELTIKQRKTVKLGLLNYEEIVLNEIRKLKLVCIGLHKKKNEQKSHFATLTYLNDPGVLKSIATAKTGSDQLKNHMLDMLRMECLNLG